MQDQDHSASPSSVVKSKGFIALLGQSSEEFQESQAGLPPASLRQRGLVSATPVSSLVD